MHPSSSPFALENEKAYQNWRHYKLEQYPFCIASNIIDISNALKPTKDEVSKLTDNCQRYNFTLYRTTPKAHKEKKHIAILCNSLGLNTLDNNLCADDDSLTTIKVTNHKEQHDYIPYSQKQLSWHTDGYYNTTSKQIHGMLLHCSQPAPKGGESIFMDHEILYILLRDENPNYISALMQPDTLTIPANILKGKEIRPPSTGPVFSITDAGNLHLRYSARTRNIIWKNDTLLQEAREFIKAIWNDETSAPIIRYQLNAGEGIICNNILHRRTSFEDSERETEKRTLYRGRYYDRINNTDINDIQKFLAQNP